jgi:WD40 repeat protein
MKLYISALLAIIATMLMLTWCAAAPVPPLETEAKELATLVAKSGPGAVIRALSFSADGKVLASADRGSVRVWDVVGRKEIGVFKGTPSDRFKNTVKWIDMDAVALSPDGKTVASSGSMMPVQLWDVATCENTVTIPETFGARKLNFSPDGKALAWEGKTISVYNLESKQTREPFGDFRESGKVYTLGFTSKAKLLVATVSSENKVRFVDLWDGDTGKKAATLLGHGTNNITSTAVALDGKTAASLGNDDTLRIWDTASGKNTASYEIEAKKAGPLALSPDGKLLAAGYRLDEASNNGNHVRIYEVATGKVLAKLEGYTDVVSIVVFSPDGRKLASGADRTIKVWSVPEAWTAEK